MINTGDTAFMMICAALVFIMTPGWHSSMAAWFPEKTY